MNVGGEDWAARSAGTPSRPARACASTGADGIVLEVTTHMIVFLFVVAVFLLVVLMKSIKIVPQKQVKIIERLGKYHGTAEAGLNVILPFVDSRARTPSTCASRSPRSSRSRSSRATTSRWRSTRSSTS